MRNESQIFTIIADDSFFHSHRSSLHPTSSNCCHDIWTFHNIFSYHTKQGQIN